jgi:hypothetical protein
MGISIAHTKINKFSGLNPILPVNYGYILYRNDEKKRLKIFTLWVSRIRPFVLPWLDYQGLAVPKYSCAAECLACECMPLMKKCG